MLQIFFRSVTGLFKVYSQLYFIFLVSLPEGEFEFHFRGTPLRVIPACPTLNRQNTDSWALLRVSDSEKAREFAFLTSAQVVPTRPAQGPRSERALEPLPEGRKLSPPLTGGA